MICASSYRFMVIVGLLCVAPTAAQDRPLHQPGTPHGSLESPYSGQQDRLIKGLTPSDVEGLEAGSGMVLGGLAKTAELNGYPGPKHVLEAYHADALVLTDAQYERINSLFSEMRTEAQRLGQQLLAAELALEQAFQSGEMVAEQLSTLTANAAAAQGALRAHHLSYHLKTYAVLTPDQVDAYNRLRGYTTADPCDAVPAGHDPVMWRRHNGCD